MKVYLKKIRATLLMFLGIFIAVASLNFASASEHNALKHGEAKRTFSEGFSFKK